ncbi:conserved hypothetical protein [Cryptococcus deneoformans JEC21]|uniref:Methyltransferase n=1 Tax=Cryptococcus deneoformans (strain JEC21 / ATCC MYA-565) TaxID=214684 RepID=Q5KK73_CRYD1|nr:conserved hypothetical protein [Cryptococcus neoformans var. neoformans JEC21]AAW42333.1 conserved hypothetical protein [Cryptococcus neoformans var. neoformans JEC21]
MHQNNPYLKQKPDFARLASRYPKFAPFVSVSEDGYTSINFQDPTALRELTKCLLKEDWNLDVDLREDRLCPTIPNRLDYIYHVLDLEPHLPSSSLRPLRILDIGTGATAIYPILLARLRPDSRIVATEIDESSYNHAKATLEKNNIPPSSITVLKSPTPDPILFPLLECKGKSEDWDLTICNPPFFASSQEMLQGMELKDRQAHAAPTASDNELITRGGELAFITSMIRESIDIGHKCTWYTTLVGKYSSLQPLIETLREFKIDNYFVINMKQSRTSRWILGWSHTMTRLPDSITRPYAIMENTTFAQLLPSSNTVRFNAPPPVSLTTLKAKVLDVLRTVALDPSKDSPDPSQYEGETQNSVLISPRINTWSRAARRMAARQESKAEPEGQGEASKPLTLFRCRIKYVNSHTRPMDGSPSLEIDWLEGRREDREVWESFCNFLLSKLGLSRKRQAEAESDGRPLKSSGRRFQGNYARGRMAM